MHDSKSDIYFYPGEDSFEVDSAILEVDKNNETVSLEILQASKFYSSGKIEI